MEQRSRTDTQPLCLRTHTVRDLRRKLLMRLLDPTTIPVHIQQPKRSRGFIHIPYGDRKERTSVLARTLASGRGSANLAVIYNGSMEDIGFVLPFFTPQPRLTLPAYWLVNATVSYKLQPGLELFGRVENLLDQHYQESFGFAAAPLAAFAGVKLTFGGPEGLGGSWGK